MPVKNYLFWGSFNNKNWYKLKKMTENITRVTSKTKNINIIDSTL